MDRPDENPDVDSLTAPEETQTEAILRRQRESLGSSEHSVLSDITPPAGEFTMSDEHLEVDILTSPEDPQTPEAMRRQRKLKLSAILDGTSENSDLGDVTPPAKILAMDLCGAPYSPNFSRDKPAASSSPRKCSGHDSDSEEFFNRLERTMGKLSRKYLLKEDDTSSSDSGVLEFERAYLGDSFDEQNECIREPGQNVDRVSPAKSTDGNPEDEEPQTTEATRPGGKTRLTDNRTIDSIFMFDSDEDTC